MLTAAADTSPTSSETAAGQEVEVDLEKDVLTVIDSGKQYSLKSIGEVG